MINDPSRVPDAIDKRTIHLALMSVGIDVPWTILLPPAGTDGEDALAALPKVGTPFVIKPAHGGGGEGVVQKASIPEEIEEAPATRTSSRSGSARTASTDTRRGFGCRIATARCCRASGGPTAASTPRSTRRNASHPGPPASTS